MVNSANCFGLSYPTGRGANPIPGCDVDANNMAKIARMMGIQNVNVFTDKDAPITRAQILGVLEDMVYNACAGDTLLFSYAGHGGQTKDESGDEYDGADEFLVCADGMILDDEVRALLACLPAGCRMVLVFDCCHSGTMVDLETNTHELQAEIVALSAALDSQESMGFTTGGCFTAAIMRVLQEKPGISWIDAVPLIDQYDNMRTQKPVLSSNMPEALNMPAFAPVGVFADTSKGTQFAANINPFASAEEQKQDGAAPAAEAGQNGTNFNAKTKAAAAATAAAAAGVPPGARVVYYRGYPYLIPYANYSAGPRPAAAEGGAARDCEWVPPRPTIYGMGPCGWGGSGYWNCSRGAAPAEAAAAGGSRGGVYFEMPSVWDMMPRGAAADGSRGPGEAPAARDCEWVPPRPTIYGMGPCGWGGSGYWNCSRGAAPANVAAAGGSRGVYFCPPSVWDMMPRGAPSANAKPGSYAGGFASPSNAGVADARSWGPPPIPGYGSVGTCGPCGYYVW
ncbi:hypothetical protein H9P43_006326 [Blastocladiella emersonii ATCC 22665]|nr:hypothetical protein H9P43_006326 [Blastocladiella emersonii ATCC 22665]